MKKKILLGVLGVLVIGFSVNPFTANKSASAKSKDVQSSVSNVQVLSSTNGSNVSKTLLYNEKQEIKSSSGQQTTDLNSLSSYDSNGSYKATIEDGTQTIITELEPYGYPDLIIQKGVPFKWVLNVSAENLNSCNNEISIDVLEITKPLVVGDNRIEFTPTESGVIGYSCWMGMQTGTIAVVDDINNIGEKEFQNQIQSLPTLGGCCG